jgi:hypothetical protein
MFGESSEIADEVNSNNLMTENAKLIAAFADNKSKMPSYTDNVVVYEPDDYGSGTNHTITYSVSINDPLYYYFLLSKKTKTLYVHSLCYTNRGGGAETGQKTSEAELCRRTNYWKALRNVKYPVKVGTIVYSTNVKCVRNNTYTIDEEYNVDIMGIVLPNSPDIVYDNNREVYERERDRNNTIKVFNSLYYIAYSKGYTNIVFDNVGIGRDSHPIDEFITILKTLTYKLKVSFHSIMESDTTYGRRRWNKICKDLDNSGKQIFLLPDILPVEENIRNRKVTKKKKVEYEEGISNSDSD